jgi:hypothetical protein
MGEKLQLHTLLSLHSKSYEWQIQAPAAFLLGGKKQRYPFHKRLEGPKTAMNSREEHFCSFQGSNTRPSVVHPVG